MDCKIRKSIYIIGFSCILWQGCTGDDTTEIAAVDTAPDVISTDAAFQDLITDMPVSKDMPDDRGDSDVDHDVDAAPDLMTDVNSGGDSQNGLNCGTGETFFFKSDLNKLRGCIGIQGTLHLVDYSQARIPELIQLTQVDQTLLLRRSQKLATLEDLAQLHTVGARLIIDDVQMLGREESLPNLITVGEDIRLEYLPVEVLRFPNLKTISGLRIAGLPNLASLDGFERLERIDGDVRIFLPQISRSEFERFLARVEVTGEVQFNGETIDR